MPLVSTKSSYAGRRVRGVALHPAITHLAMFSMSTFNSDRDLPIVYCDRYNIRLFGLELLHRVDTKKYRQIAHHLNLLFVDTRFARLAEADETSPEGDYDNAELNQAVPCRLRYLVPNRPINPTELRNHHSTEHIIRVHEDKSTVAQIAEMWLLNLLSRCWIETRLLDPIKWQIAGTIFAANLAMQHGWSINLGGGFHEASQEAGSHYCFFSDIMLTIRYIWRKHPLQKFMIIDLDAHRAIGLEHDLGRLPSNQRERIFMVDMFNNSIQSADTAADVATNLRIELASFTGDATYLRRLDEVLTVAFDEFHPSLVIYVAGQDVLKGDRVGLLSLSENGLVNRDELVFMHAVERNKCSILMLMGGGHLTQGAKVQAQSIRHLYQRGLIWGGHRSGSRTLTRPRQSPQSATGSIKSTGAQREQQLASKMTNRSSIGPMQALKKPAELTHKSLDTIGTHPILDNQEQLRQERQKETPGIKMVLSSALNKTPIKSSRLEQPVDAVSESISTSGGANRVRKVIRVAPKAPHAKKLMSIPSQTGTNVTPAPKSASRKRILELTKKTITESMQWGKAANNK